MPLRDVEGQTQAIETLRRALTRGRVHHAYLFAGPDGVGKGLCAHALAQALLCTEPAAGDACGACRACRRVETRAHPDLQVLEREEKPDGSPQATLRIHQVRALQQALSKKAFEGGRRVVIIHEAEKMNAATANALLKTLEEPGADTHFVLVSAAAHRLLPTILSRCQRVRFVPLSLETVSRHLGRLLEDGAADARLLAALAEGSISKGLALVHSGVLEHREALLTRIAAGQGLADIPDLLDQAETLARAKEELPYVFHLLRTWYRDLLLIQRGLGDEALVHSDLAAMARQQATRVDQRRILGYIDQLNATEQSIFERYGNTRLFMERLLLTLAGIDEERAA